MPELPEVETIRRDLAEQVIGLTISAIQVLDDRVIRNCSARQFCRQCLGKTITTVTRRGKAIVIQFSPPGYAIIQPMMTGHLVYDPVGEKVTDRDTKIVFTLSNQSRLNYNDQRLFGRIQYVDDLKKIEFFRHIGPEPLEKEFTVDWLKLNLEKSSGPIKSLLMNQHFIAGIGNIYASEILFRSRISPRRSARRLKREEIALLHRATVDILKEAVSLRGTSMRNYRDLSGTKGNFMNRIKVYGREQEKCLQCKTPITKIVQAGRSTFYCKRCQR